MRERTNFAGIHVLPQTIAEEVIAHLTGLVGADVTVSLDIAANMPEGAPSSVVRTVSENSRTLKFQSHEFEES